MIRPARIFIALTTLSLAALSASAAQPAPGAPALATAQAVSRPPAPPQPTRGGGRRPIEVMTLATNAWPDGAAIPTRFTQAGDEVSPALTWSGAPEGVVSFAVLAHDVDAAAGDGTGDVLHWLLWNIPGTSTGVPEGLPHVSQLPDGTRQISQTGPSYRGPGAMAAGPTHHYVFEVFALDTALEVPAVGASPAETRAAIVAAMAGHVRGKGAYLGLFKRGAATR